MKHYIKSIFNYFLYIYVMASIGAATFISVVQPKVILHVSLFWQLLLACLEAAVITALLLDPVHDVSKRQMFIRLIINYFAVYALILGTGWFWGWLDIYNKKECIAFSIMFLGIYATIYLISYIRGNWLAAQLNEKIKSNNQ